MNNARRKEINKAIGMVEEARALLEAVRDAEQEAFDSMPESFQNGDRGEKMQACISDIEDSIGDCENIEERASAMKGD